MKVLISKTTKYKSKLYYAGDKIDVTKKKATEWQKLGIAKIIETNKPNNSNLSQTKKDNQEQELKELQETAKALGIDIEGKGVEELKKELEGLD